MSNAAFATTAPATSRAEPIPVGTILPWAVFASLMLLLAVYFVGAEEGATSLIGGSYVHEFVHDGRHLLGFPCH
ncbi:CbtB domain-containing protein [Hansschlegelia zhihuaiae]|uniref:CbtB-domain containing protein n=1 Tax=Hansschlegelia zhihuaiae TaxID=405005 RepID=A0A4Q0MH15_9HYPH|nr:CbtB-domain containing protein [Hansschlegelia zhihuaiae]RXF72780.1 CbtB-domain containing protein [Hansschlegelia zhihuaiae]